MDKVEEWASKNYRHPLQARHHKKQLQAFIDWSKKTPNQLVKEGLEGIAERTAPRLIGDYKAYLDKERARDPEHALTEISAFDAISAIRSFYRYYGLQTKFARSELEAPVSIYIDHRFSLAEINGMVHTATSLRNKSIILVAVSSGLREMDIALLPKKRIEDLLNGEAPVGIGPIITAKKRVKAYPFLHSVAVETLKRYLATRKDKVDLLFPTDSGKPCQGDYLDRMVKWCYDKAGFKAAEGERVRFHCLRKFTISRMQDSGLEENVWKTLIGKSTKEAPYTTEMLREHFLKVQDRLNPEALANNHVKMEELEAKIASYEKELTELRSRKSVEDLLGKFGEQMSKTLQDAFKKAQPASEAINGHEAIGGHEGSAMEPIVIDGSEILALKALAQTFQRLYKESKETKTKKEDRQTKDGLV